MFISHIIKVRRVCDDGIILNGLLKITAHEISYKAVDLTHTIFSDARTWEGDCGHGAKESVANN